MPVCTVTTIPPKDSFECFKSFYNPKQSFLPYCIIHLRVIQCSSAETLYLMVYRLVPVSRLIACHFCWYIDQKVYYFTTCSVGVRILRSREISPEIPTSAVVLSQLFGSTSHQFILQFTVYAVCKHPCHTWGWGGGVFQIVTLRPSP